MSETVLTNASSSPGKEKKLLWSKVHREFQQEFIHRLVAEQHHCDARLEKAEGGNNAAKRWMSLWLTLQESYNLEDDFFFFFFSSDPTCFIAKKIKKKVGRQHVNDLDLTSQSSELNPIKDLSKKKHYTLKWIHHVSSFPLLDDTDTGCWANSPGCKFIAGKGLIEVCLPLRTQLILKGLVGLVLIFCWHINMLYRHWNSGCWYLKFMLYHLFLQSFFFSFPPTSSSSSRSELNRVDTN